VAIWSVGTKVFNMVLLVTRRILDFSVPPLAEMLVRKEHNLLRERFKGVTIVSALIGGLGAVLIAACNTSFVTVWTHGRITWTTGRDVLLGAWLIVLALRHCHASLVGVSKDIRFMRFIFLLEGLVFVTLASIVIPWGGLTGLIGCSVICNICISGLYGMRRSAEYFRVPLSEIAWNWLQPLRRTLLWLVPLAMAVCWLSAPLTAWACVVVRGVALGSFGVCILLRYGLPLALKRELVQRVPGFVGRRLRPVMGEIG